MVGIYLLIYPVDIWFLKNKQASKQVNWVIADFASYVCEFTWIHVNYFLWMNLHSLCTFAICSKIYNFLSKCDMCWDKIFIIKSFWSTQCLKILLNKLYWCGFKMFFIRRLQSCCLNLQCTSEKPGHLFSLNYRSLSYICMFTCNRSKEIKK